MISSASTFRVNGVVFIESLADDELHTGRWAEEDLAAEFDAMPLHHEYRPVRSKAELLNVLKELTDAVAHGLMPIVQFDIHGSDDKTGLIVQPTRELVTWEELAGPLRALNRATGNNLNVVMACCYGFHGIVPIRITDVTPFLHLVGPEETESAGTIQASMPGFYRALFMHGSIEAGVNALPKSFRLFYAEKVLVISFLRYLVVGTRGTGKAERIERLLTELTGRRPDLDVNATRKTLRTLITPENANFEQFKARFLLSDLADNRGRFNISLQDCLDQLHAMSPETIAQIRANARLD